MVTKKKTRNKFEQPQTKLARYEKNRLWIKANIDLVRKYKRKYARRKAGLLDTDKAEALITTSSFCQVCGSEENLCVDHCHSSGEIRGVLCDYCNKALGMFKDNRQFLLNAIKYLSNEKST